MPVLINEVVAEVTESVAPESETHPPALQMPLSMAEFQIAQTLALIEHRRQRLHID